MLTTICSFNKLWFTSGNSSSIHILWLLHRRHMQLYLQMLSQFNKSKTSPAKRISLPLLQASSLHHLTDQVVSPICKQHWGDLYLFEHPRTQRLEPREKKLGSCHRHSEIRPRTPSTLSSSRSGFWLIFQMCLQQESWGFTYAIWYLNERLRSC